MPTFRPHELEPFGAALCVAAGAPPDIATAVARSLVAADLCGHESHGLMRIGRYLERVRNGTMQPAARPAIARRRGANASVDGGWGFGQIAAQFGTQLAIEICPEHGQAGVALSHTHHIGRLGDYAETLAAAGLAGLIMTGGGNRGGSVAPHGGRQRIFGTNPIAMAVPTPPPHPPLVFDFAMRSSPPAEGFAEVLVPGEVEARTRAQRTQDGIPISDGVWAELSTQAARLGVAVPGG